MAVQSSKVFWVLCAVALLAGCASTPTPDEKKPREKPTMAATVSSVTLEDVPLGVPVGLRLPNGGYYALRNDSSATLNAVVSPMVPTYCQRLPGQPVYLPVTNLSWIAVEPREFKIPPHSESEAMVVITLPNDESLRGRHLEFWLHAQALVGGMGSVGLYSRIRLNVEKAGASVSHDLVTPRPAKVGSRIPRTRANDGM